MAETLRGTGVTPVVGLGPAHWLAADLALGEPPDPGSVDPETERARFERARDAVQSALERERDRIAAEVGTEEAAIFEAHEAFLLDPQIESGVTDRIDDGGAAPHAVHDTFDEHVAQFADLEGPMAERADDLRDLRDRVVRELLRPDEPGAERTLPEQTAAIPDGAVVLAERLTPSQTAAFDPEQIAGIATATGGGTAHAAIIARSLGIPAVVGIGESLSAIDDGTPVLVDGDRGVVVPAPDADAKQRLEARGTVEPIHEAVSTADGVPIEIGANVAGREDLADGAAMGADGVGLFRSEFCFFDRDTPPGEAEQVELYSTALEQVSGRVIVRTLDVGGDKPLPYRGVGDERSPFLGARGVRLCLDGLSDLFETQLRALCRAAGTTDGDRLAVMIPMITTVEELEDVLALIDRIAAELSAAGQDHAIPELGIMIETPAAVMLADDLASRVDFLSIGTNDLTQYVMAADRENEQVGHLQDPLAPAVIRAIARTVDGGHAGNCWVGMCGELAGNTDATELLVGLGLDELSMSPIRVPGVKRRVQAIDSTAAETVAARALEAATAEQVRSVLAS